MEKSGITVDISRTGIDERVLSSVLMRALDFNDLLQRQELDPNWNGWVDFPGKFLTTSECARLLSDAARLREEIEILVVIAIGGSYTGTKAILDAVRGSYGNRSSSREVEIIFSGRSLSSRELREQLEYVSGRPFAINVVSKSGTTLEIVTAFREFYTLLIKEVGEEIARRRIYITTDPESGYLRLLVHEQGYISYSIPSNIGGRFSLFTPVGLFPLAVAGLDVISLLRGAEMALGHFYHKSDMNNPALIYAAARNILARQYPAEMLVSYEPCLMMTNEWWKQIYGESEGKDNKGLLPISAIFSTDLHSIGQYIQEGPHLFFQTTLWIDQGAALTLTTVDNNNGYDYLNGRSMHEINKCVYQASVESHNSVAQIPQIIITLEDINEYRLGELFAFWMISCAVSASILGVNPFDQPGVEVYKRKMLELLK